MAKRDWLTGFGLILVGVVIGVVTATLEEHRVITNLRSGMVYDVISHGAVCQVAADLSAVEAAELGVIAARSLGCVVIGPGFKGTVLGHQGVLVKIRVTPPGLEFAELENFVGWTAAANLGAPAT
jgi:hypothetical protein